MTRCGLMIWGQTRKEFSSLKRLSENTKKTKVANQLMQPEQPLQMANIHHMNSSSFLFSCITVRLTKQHGGLIQGRSFANSISCLINNDSRRLPYGSSSLIPRKCCSKLLFSGNPAFIIFSINIRITS